MRGFTIKAFRPSVPRQLDRLLDPNQASVAKNCKLTGGKIEPIFSPLVNAVLPDTVRSMARYRVFKNYAWTENWLTWAYPVDFVLSPLSNDQEGRFYFCGDSIEPRMSNFASAIDAAAPYPAAWYALGIAAPTAAPTVAVAGGSGILESRGYVHTFVTALGEESGPSPVSTIVSGYANGTWNLSGMQAAPLNTGAVTAAVATPLTGRVLVTLSTVFGIAQYDTVTFSGVAGMTDLNGSWRLMSVDTATNKVEVSLVTTQTYTSGGAWTRNAPHNTSGMTRRIYRTNGDAESYFFVAGNIPVATTTYADTVPGTNLGEVLPTLNTVPPPKDMFSLVSLPNGCLAGITKDEVCFSDPYLPYSWPIGNRYSFSGNGVALVAMGNSVLVLTDSFPILLSGSDPEAMSPSTVQTYAPCLAKEGVVDMGGACLYPSYDGLWLVSPGQSANITKKFFRVEEWTALQPSSFRAEFFDGKYFASFEKGSVREMLILDVDEPDGVVYSSVHAETLHRSDQEGKLFISNDRTIYQWDGDTNRPMISEWVSATVQLPKPMNLSTVQIQGDYSVIGTLDDTGIAANAALIAGDAFGGALGGDAVLALGVNDSFLQSYANFNRYSQFTIYCDGNAVFSRYSVNNAPFRLPAGFKYETFNIGITANVPVYAVSIAPSVVELGETA